MANLYELSKELGELGKSGECGGLGEVGEPGMVREPKDHGGVPTMLTSG